jgi:hypothetical protein
VIGILADAVTLDRHSGYYTSLPLPSQALDRLYRHIFPTPNYVFLPSRLTFHVSLIPSCSHDIMPSCA